MDQRKFYKLWNEKKRTQLTQERIDKLNKIGFYWGKTMPTPVKWETHFNELKEHRDKYGNCDIKIEQKFADCSPLAKWVRLQRLHYKNRHKQGLKRQYISKERIEKLDSIGFDWKGPSGLGNEQIS